MLRMFDPRESLYRTLAIACGVVACALLALVHVLYNPREHLIANVLSVVVINSAVFGMYRFYRRQERCNRDAMLREVYDNGSAEEVLKTAEQLQISIAATLGFNIPTQRWKEFDTFSFGIFMASLGHILKIGEPVLLRIAELLLEKPAKYQRSFIYGFNVKHRSIGDQLEKAIKAVKERDPGLYVDKARQKKIMKGLKACSSVRV